MNETSVSINGHPCDVSFVTYDTITCTTNPATADGIHNVEVTVRGTPIISTFTYEYTSSGMASISSVSQATLIAAQGINCEK